MAYDLYGNEIIVDMLDETHEAVEAWNVVANACVAEGLGYFISADGTRTEKPHVDDLGRIRWRFDLPLPDTPKPKPHERTLADVRPDLDMNDSFDAAMAALPIHAGLLDKTAAALLAGVAGPIIQARLQCSASTVTAARKRLREEVPEEQWPESLRNAKSHSRRVNLARPHMGGPNNAFARAADSATRMTGVPVCEADMRQRAREKRQARKMKERAEDLARNLGQKK